VYGGGLLSPVAGLATVEEQLPPNGRALFLR